MAGKFKTLEDVIESGFYNLALPEGYEAPSFWGGSNKYQINASVISNGPGRRNYTKLEKPKKAREFLNSLASKFNHENLIGLYGKAVDWFNESLIGKPGYKKIYDVTKEGNTLKAVYDLGRNSIFDGYDRKIEVTVNLEDGTVDAKLICNELVPEKIIARDLYKLRRAFRQRFDYFVKNPAAPTGTAARATTTDPTTTTTTTPATPLTPVNPQAPQITYTGQISTPRGNLHSAEMGGQPYALIPLPQDIPAAGG